MAAAIADELKIEPELVQGSNAIFDIVVDGDIIFSKRKVHRFPGQDEILDMLRERLTD